MAAGPQTLSLVGGDRLAEIPLPAGTVVIDFSTPQAAAANAQRYTQLGVPFVMGTTGFDADAVQALVASSAVSAVVAPNMAPPIVLLQAAMRWLADTFPGSCAGSGLAVRESHQQGKRDTSGTAKALVQSFQQLGVDFGADQITQVRDPQRQRAELGVPEEHLAGHAYHRYDLSCADGTVQLALEHNVLGRRVYAEGALLAARYLSGRLADGSRGEVFSMRDVLCGG